MNQSVNKTLRQDGYKIRIFNNCWDNGSWRCPIFSIYKENDLYGCGYKDTNNMINYDQHKEIEQSIYNKIIEKVKKFYKKYNK